MGKAHTLQTETLCGRAQLKENGVHLELGTWREHRQEMAHPDAPAPKDCVIRTSTRLACPTLPCAPANVVIPLPAAPPSPKGWVNLQPASATSLMIRDVRVVSTQRTVE